MTRTPTARSMSLPGGIEIRSQHGPKCAQSPDHKPPATERGAASGGLPALWVPVALGSLGSRRTVSVRRSPRTAGHFQQSLNAKALELPLAQVAKEVGCRHYRSGTRPPERSTPDGPTRLTIRLASRILTAAAGDVPPFSFPLLRPTVDIGMMLSYLTTSFK